MNVYCLGIDRKKGNSSYEELKSRKVVAQGWPEVGDLSPLLDFAPEGLEEGKKNF